MPDENPSILVHVSDDALITEVRRRMKARLPTTRPRGRPSAFAGKSLWPKVKENPRREGSYGFRSMAIILDDPGLSYERFIGKGGRRRDLRWDVRRGHVSAKEPQAVNI